MATTLTYGATTLTLPDDLAWPDEFAWSAVESRQTYSVGGALLIDSAVKLAGRPITLQSGEDHGWATRSLAASLYAWAQLPGAAFTLSFRSVSYAVRFDHSAGAFESRDVVGYSDPNSTDDCVITLRFITTG